MTATIVTEKPVVRTDNRKMRRDAMRYDNRPGKQSHLHPSQVKAIMMMKHETKA
jgi:hypothetical protein